MLLQLGGDLLRVLADLVVIGADHADRDRLRGAEAHDLAHDVARLESEGGLLGLLPRPRLRASRRPPPCSSRSASQGITRSGRTLRSRSRNSSSLMPLSSFKA